MFFPLLPISSDLVCNKVPIDFSGTSSDFVDEKAGGKFWCSLTLQLLEFFLRKALVLVNFSALVGGVDILSLVCLAPLGQKLISAVAQVVLSSPLTWLHRKEAL